MFYKNTSYFVKTFYGVTFQPQEIKEVGEYINDKFLVLVDGPQVKSAPIQQKLSSDQSTKKVAPKPEEVKVEPVAEETPAEEPVVLPAKDSTKSSNNKERKS